MITEETGRGKVAEPHYNWCKNGTTEGHRVKYRMTRLASLNSFR